MKMYKVEIYEDKKGNSPVANFIAELDVRARTSKEHRIRLKKNSRVFTASKNIRD